MHAHAAAAARWIACKAAGPYFSGAKPIGCEFSETPLFRLELSCERALHSPRSSRHVAHLSEGRSYVCTHSGSCQMDCVQGCRALFLNAASSGEP
jgi:hypothetical protein